MKGMVELIPWWYQNRQGRESVRKSEHRLLHDFGIIPTSLFGEGEHAVGSTAVRSTSVFEVRLCRVSATSLRETCAFPPTPREVCTSSNRSRSHLDRSHDYLLYKEGEALCTGEATTGAIDGLRTVETGMRVVVFWTITHDGGAGNNKVTKRNQSSFYGPCLVSELLSRGVSVS